MRWTPWRQFDWNLRSCGLHGHITYAPREAALAERLHVATPAGQAWRCLRCGTYVIGAPHGSGPADRAPIVLRGAALKDAFILRLLAAERAVRGLGLALIAAGMLRFSSSTDVLERTLADYLPLVKPLADRLGYDLEHSGVVRLLHEALDLNHTTLLWATAGVAAYAALQLTEAVGLWRLRRWGEYVAVVGTSAFIPLEVYEVVHGATWLKVAALLVNLFAVAYLVWTKRLFGVRGGHAALVHQREAVSLIEVEAAAVAQAPASSPRGPQRAARTPRHPEAR